MIPLDFERPARSGSPTQIQPLQRKQPFRFDSHDQQTPLCSGYCAVELAPHEEIRPPQLLGARNLPRLQRFTMLINATRTKHMPFREIEFSKLEENIHDILGRNLFEIRSRAKITQKRMADILNISTSQWKKYEHGKEMLRMDNAVTFSEITGVPLQRLFSGTAYSPSQEKPHQLYYDNLCRKVTQLPGVIFIEYQKIISATFNLDKHINLSSQDLALSNLTTSTRKKTFFTSIGANIREYRNTIGCTQKIFSDTLNISLSACQRYESPNRSARFGLLLAARLQSATDIQPIQLLKGTEFSKSRINFNKRTQDFYRIIHNIPESELEEFETLSISIINLLMKRLRCS